MVHKRVLLICAMFDHIRYVLAVAKSPIFII